MTFAVIATGGKQYLVKKGSKIKVEKLPGKKGDAVSFSEVICIADGEGKECTLGNPTIAATEVGGKILSQSRSPKIRVVKYKNKIRYKRTIGHRQAYTAVEITHIGASKQKKG